jgi:serine/threonine protein kinase
LINKRYEIIKKLGEGRSSVYLCRDIEFPEKEIGIKILPAKADEKERSTFLKELFILQKLEHPNIIKPYEFGAVFLTDGEEGIQPGSSFITMEYFDGEKLLDAEIVKNEKFLKEVVKQICAALYYLHQSRYIYYDLKPDNILVSFQENKIHVKLIDLGLAEYFPDPSDYEVKGTAHYIAPELLKKDPHDHSVDFYSLGIILYQIIYNKFPFDAQSEIDIYKASIEHNFSFPSSEKFSPNLIEIVKKLLGKDISSRYKSALALVKDLGFNLDISLTEDFLPAKVFACREDIIKILSTYISNKTSSEVFSIKGFDGVGKSTIIHRLREIFNASILIAGVKGKSGAELIRYILRHIIFSEQVFPQLSDEEKKILFGVLEKNDTEIIDHLRSVIILLSSKSKFVLLIDDFNLFDQFSVDLLLEIIPYLQVNKIKVISAESSEHDFPSSRLNNVREITLGAFTESELDEFLDASYIKEFPQKKLHNLIVSYADLIPGNIKLFIKDLILFGMLKFSGTGVQLSDEGDKLSDLKKTNFAVYDLRLANLNDKELLAAKVISAIDTYIDQNTFAQLIDLSIDASEKIISKLQEYNIIQKNTTDQSLNFTSESMKKHVYASMSNKKAVHQSIAKKITNKIPEFNRLEEARQYELAGEFEICYRISMTELEEAEKHSSFSYMKKILEHLKELPLQQKMMDTVRFKLCEVYYKLGDIKSALAALKELKNTQKQTESGNNFFSIEGSILIASGEYELGKKVINNLLKKIKSSEEKQRLSVELAYTDFEIKNYGDARKQCDKIITEENLSAELTGRCYNLKGMIDIYQNNDLSSALENFQQAKKYFTDSKQPLRVSGVEVNIGNIYNMLADYPKAEEHWNIASSINQSVGNLDQEGLLLQNFGLFYMDRYKFDSAIEFFQKAQTIFLSLGKEINYGLILINLGEAYFKTCDYQKALINLKESYKIFGRLKNYEETSEALMLLGRLYFNIGFTVKFHEVLALAEAKLKEAVLPAKYHTNLKYLKILSSLLKEENNYSDKINELMNKYKELDERNMMLEVNFLLIKSFIYNSQNDKALNLLFNNELIDLCSQNSILEAEREYFLGLLSRSYATDKLLPPLTHFEKAYELIKDENISELTWKILFAISELYIERGNLNKAKQYVFYTRELIYFIAEKLDSPRLRAAYLQQNERFRILRKLESYFPA